MDKILVKQLEEAKKKTSCEKGFICLENMCIEPCLAQYHACADLLECIDVQTKTCKFSIPFSKSHVCSCQLRKFLALNLGKQWGSG